MRSVRCLLCLWLAIACVFILIQARPAAAQVPGMPKLYGEFKMPEVGSYATYKVIHTQNNVERETKLSIVGKEKTKEGEDLYWYEVSETNPKTGEVVIVKMLISGNPQEIGTIQRMIMKSGKEPATELPPEILAMINQAPVDTGEAVKPKMKNLGMEKMKIMDKTLECAHMQYISKDDSKADVWTNIEIPLFGMVKSTSPETTMELMEYGTDAVSAIKEKPEVLPMPEGK
jgi:hypothetical protein